MTSNNNDIDDRATDNASVPPPAAAAASSATFHNNHIHQQAPPRKRKPTPNYHGLKHKQLLELCHSESIPTTGCSSDSELKHRHSEFIMLYNAECDSQHPLSAQEVIAEIMKQEKGRKREAKEALRNGTAQHTIYMKRLSESMSNSSSSGGEDGKKKVTTGSKKLDGEMDQKFKDMIEKVKARKNGEEKVDDGDGGDENQGGVVPSCIAAATAANNASKPRATRSSGVSVVATAPSMKAAASTTSFRTKSISTKDDDDVKPKAKATPSKSHRSTATSTTRALSKNQATLSSAKKKQSSSFSSISAGPWKCNACTFENHKFKAANARCEMCDAPRPEKENTSNSEVIAIDC